MMATMGLEPLAVLGLAAVIAMAISPRASDGTTRGIAALGLLAALILAAASQGALTSALLTGDAAARFGTGLCCLSGLAALAILRPASAPREAPALILLATLGASVLAGAAHAATLFVGLELVTLALIALTVLPRSAPALEAGYKLLILGGIGAATLLMGLAFAFAVTGELTFAAWSSTDRLVALGAALLLAGLAFKFSLVPFHMWTPDIFSGAPAAAAIVAGVASKVGVAIVLLRLQPQMPASGIWQTGLAALGIASVVLGNLQALRQPSLPRMLGFSSIAHSGYLALILASGAADTSQAVLFYIATYAPALFAALTAAAILDRDANLTDLRGLVWAQPMTGAVLTLALLSLAGLPLAVGFWAKFQLFSALAQAGTYGLLAVAILGSAAGLYFYLRFTVTLFRRDGVEFPRPPHWQEAAVLLAAAAAIVGLGVYPVPLDALVTASLP